MIRLEELTVKVHRANAIIQDALNTTDIIKIPESDNITGILIFRIDPNKGIYTTCIGCIDFKLVAAAVKDWDTHKQEHLLQLVK